jgi:hypothetical protein
MTSASYQARSGKTVTTLYLSTSIQVGSKAPFAVPWQSALHVADGSWSSVFASKLFVPPGCSWIALRAGISFEADPAGMRQIYSRRNGSEERSHGYGAGYMSHTHPPGSPEAGALAFTAHSATMPVAPGDYFELMVYQDSGSPLWLTGLADSGGSSSAQPPGPVYLEARFW